MGEARHRKRFIGSSAIPDQTREALDELVRTLIDKGLLIEAGFAGLRATAIPPDAPPEQLLNMRIAFFAGAQHLFGSIMQAMESGTEPTEADEKRMGAIAAELQHFIDDYMLRHGGAAGRA